MKLFSGRIENLPGVWSNFVQRNAPLILRRERILRQGVLTEQQQGLLIALENELFATWIASLTAQDVLPEQ